MSGHDGDDRQVPQPQGTYAGLPFGWGWAFNFYGLVHPVRLVRARRSR